MEATEKEAIRKMMEEAVALDKKSNELYHVLAGMIGQGTVQSFLIDVLFDGDKLKYATLEAEYRKDSVKFKQHAQYDLFALYSRISMGISRAKREKATANELETVLAMYYFTEFKMPKEAAAVAAKTTATDIKTEVKPADIPKVIEEITKGKTPAVAKETAKATKKTTTPAVHKDVKMDQVQAFVEKASEELILKALIEKAKKKGASALCQALEMILPLTQVSVNVVSKAPEANSVSTESVDLLSMWK